MREVRVFLTPNLHTSTPSLVNGLKDNNIYVSSVAHEQYQAEVDSHYHFLQQQNAREDVTPRNFLCIVFAETKEAVLTARKLDMTVIGIANEGIHRDYLQTAGAHIVAASIDDVLEKYGVRNYYQIMYLPYILRLNTLAQSKIGYPVSLLDMMDGQITDTGIKIGEIGHRVIPREVLGIKPGSLADAYINNVGWPMDSINTFGLNTRDIERDIIRMFEKFYRLQPDHMRGFVTTGGTEGNFAGLWWLRDFLTGKMKSKHHKKRDYSPILLASDQTHYSVSKAAHQLGIEGQVIPSLVTGEIDCQALGCALDKLHKEQPYRPIIMMINIGTTKTGAIDDLPKVRDLLIKKIRERGGEFAIHLDAALLGAILPIINPFGDYDYFAKDVKTIAISGHKFFGSSAICGVCLTTKDFLEKEYQKYTSRDDQVSYLTGLHDITPSGSRSGFNALSFHNTLCGLDMHTDYARLKLITEQCYANAYYFYDEMVKVMGKDNVLHPNHSLTLCFPRPSTKMREHYQLMPVAFPPQFRKQHDYVGVCVLANVTKDMIDEFVATYKDDPRIKAIKYKSRKPPRLFNTAVKKDAVIRRHESRTAATSQVGRRLANGQ